MHSGGRVICTRGGGLRSWELCEYVNHGVFVKGVGWGVPRMGWGSQCWATTVSSFSVNIDPANPYSLSKLNHPSYSIRAKPHSQPPSGKVSNCLNYCLSSLFALGFPGSSEGKASACNAGDLGLIPGSGRSPGVLLSPVVLLTEEMYFASDTVSQRQNVLFRK